MRSPTHSSAFAIIALLAALSLPLGSHAESLAPVQAPAIPSGENGKHPSAGSPAVPSTPAPADSTAKSPNHLSPGSKQPVEAGKTSIRKEVDSLSPADLDTIVSVVKERYVEPEALSETDLKRDTVQGMLDRLGPGVVLLSEPSPPLGEPAPVKTETLPNKAGYIRLGTLTPAALEETAAALKKFSAEHAPALILDLRAVPAGTNFEAAAEVSRLFCPKGKLLFTVQKPKAKSEIFTSKDDPLWQGILVVLVSSASSGNAELIAGTLRLVANGMVIGQPTKGEAAEFAEQPLSEGRRLRLAIAQGVLADKVAIVPHGLQPDLPVETSLADTATVLKQELEKGAAALVLEPHYARMNEAALVAGTNPDLDRVIANQQNKGEKNKDPLRDVVLQRAIDFVTTITIYQPGGKSR